MGTVSSDAPPLVDMGDCHDVFVSGIARIERLPGECLRFVCYVEEEGGTRRTVILKTIWPISVLANAMRQTAEAISTEQVMIKGGEIKLAH